MIRVTIVLGTIGLVGCSVDPGSVGIGGSLDPNDPHVVISDSGFRLSHERAIMKRQAASMDAAITEQPQALPAASTIEDGRSAPQGQGRNQ